MQSTHEEADALRKDASGRTVADDVWESRGLRLLHTRDRAWNDAAPPGRASLLSGLRAALDRKMAHWALGYLAVAWLVLQLTDVLKDIWGWPLSLQRGICLALALGLLPALVVSWFHGERGRQRINTVEVLLVGALLIGAGGVVWAVCAR